MSVGTVVELPLDVAQRMCAVMMAVAQATFNAQVIDTYTPQAKGLLIFESMKRIGLAVDAAYPGGVHLVEDVAALGMIVCEEDEFGHVAASTFIANEAGFHLPNVRKIERDG